MPSGATSHRLRNSARLGDALRSALERKVAEFAVSLRARPNVTAPRLQSAIDLASPRLPKGTIITSASSTT